MGFNPPFAKSCRVARSHPGLAVRLAVRHGYLFGVVVEVAAAVRPPDVVHDEDGQQPTRPPRARCEHLQLVVDGVPVVVAVYEGDVHGAEGGEHVVTRVAMEDVAPGELAFMVRRVELGHRVDHVQLGVGSEPLEHEHRGLSARCPDLDDATRADGVENGCDGDFPEGEHPCPLFLVFLAVRWEETVPVAATRRARRGRGEEQRARARPRRPTRREVRSDAGVRRPKPSDR